MTTITRAIKDKALATLDGNAQIVKDEMLIHGRYVTPRVVDEKKAASGAICKGHKYCEIGALFVAYGIQPQPFTNDFGVKSLGMPEAEIHTYWLSKEGDGTTGINSMGLGLGQGRREHPALALAYDALNAAAQDFARGKFHPYTERRTTNIERVFEGWDCPTPTRHQLLDVIADARQRVEAMPVAEPVN